MKLTRLDYAILKRPSQDCMQSTVRMKEGYAYRFNAGSKTYYGKTIHETREAAYEEAKALKRELEGGGHE